MRQVLFPHPDVGKTSLIQVLLHGHFQDKISNTLGACYHRFDTHDPKGDPLTIDIWDTAGQEKFRSLLTLYYKNSDAVIIVFDLTLPQTLLTVDYWAREIDANCEVLPCTSHPIQVLCWSAINLISRKKGMEFQRVKSIIFSTNIRLGAIWNVQQN